MGKANLDYTIILRDIVCKNQTGRDSDNRHFFLFFLTCEEMVQKNKKCKKIGMKIHFQVFKGPFREDHENQKNGRLMKNDTFGCFLAITGPEFES